MDEDECLQRITELVYDDNEIVTATSLSKILKIKIHNAQSLLDKYVKNADVPGQTDLSWTITIIGSDTDAGLSISIVKQDEIEKVKNKLQTVLAEHVFSVERNGDIDLANLANVEPFTENKVQTEPLQGSVVSKNAVKRKLKKSPVISINEVKQDVHKVENKQNTSVEGFKPKKNGIESFYTKGPATSSTQSKPVFNSKAKQKNMMANFFSKSNSFNTTPIINEDVENEKNIGNACSNDTIEETKMDVDDKPTSKIMETCSDENEKELKDKEDSKQVKKSKKRKSQHKSGQTSKRRKRIVETADSDSDIFASSESEVEVIPDIHYSDDNYEEEIKSQPVVPMKAREMKQITEEFMGEDGFLNTVQKYVIVSGDEEEDNKEQNDMNNILNKPVIETKNPSLRGSKKEISLKKPSKNKDKSAKTVQNQPTIMNFFKKT